MKLTAKAHWNGTLQEGSGEVSTRSILLNETRYSFKTRFVNGKGTNPEELIAAVHAACFCVALNGTLAYHGITAGDIFTTAIVDLDVEAQRVTGIHLELQATVIDGLDEVTFIEIVESAKAHCIISKALGVPVTFGITYSDM